MLSVLHIENIAVIEQADITFGGGFNVLTGETGAGKSIVIDAISAILGERTYRDVIRTGAPAASVSAVFTGTDELPWFAANGVSYDPAELLIQREIYPDGKNVCRVNGRPVTVSILRTLGEQLITIHGQHDSQQLFDESTHLKYLDLFAKDDVLRGAYTEEYDRLQNLKKQIEHLSMDESEKARRVETLRFQIGELEQAGLKRGEEAELEARRKLLQNSEKLISALEDAAACLYGGDETDGAAALIAQAEQSLRRCTDFGTELESLYSRVADLMYTAQDLAEEVTAQKDSFDFSGDELEQVESRLDVLHRLRKKYGPTVDDMLAYLENAKKELDEIEFSDDRIERLKKQAEVQEKTALQKALELRAARKAAATVLEQRISTELEQLDMHKVQFSCEFSTQEPPVLTAAGADEVRFLMSANVGEAKKPLSKIASGGELARIMLALKNVLAEQDAIPTLIFDEVDAGVSGRAAQKVAEKLHSVAGKKQVLCVTHLPQIAAMADLHFQIEKQEHGGRTFTRVEPLDFEGRKRELARIIGGAKITETTIKSAEEMLRH